MYCATSAIPKSRYGHDGMQILTLILMKIITDLQGMLTLCVFNATKNNIRQFLDSSSQIVYSKGVGRFYPRALSVYRLLS